MSDFELAIDGIMEEEISLNAEMVEEVIQVDTGADTMENGMSDMVVQGGGGEVVPTRVTFVDHLRSPIVELCVGEGDAQVCLSAHQALLVQSPFFEDACSQFDDNTLV